MEEIQAQFLVQGTFEIPPQHWAYMILDINIALRAGDYLSTKSLRKYVKRTFVVLGGLCDHIPEIDAQRIKNWQDNTLDGYEKIGEFSSSKRMEFCAKLLNTLHGTMKLYERNAHPKRREEFNRQLGELTKIDLDKL